MDQCLRFGILAETKPTSITTVVSECRPFATGCVGIADELDTCMQHAATLEYSLGRITHRLISLPRLRSPVSSF